MKLILAVIQADDANRVVQALNDAGFSVTRIATQGGWLRRENATLLIGVDDRRVDAVLGVLQDHAQRRTATINMTSESVIMGNVSSTAGMPMVVEAGGATVFVLNVERMARLPSPDYEG